MIQNREDKYEMNNSTSFAERHPKINALFGFLLLLLLIYCGGLFVQATIRLIGNELAKVMTDLKRTVSNTDKVIIVAMITGSVSIIGVVISSIVAKVVDYRFNVKKYLYDKREAPYEQFIDMVYKIMEDTKKAEKDRMSEEEMISMISEFSKGLTLWGSNQVAKKWIKYRKQCEKDNVQNLFLLEDIIYEMRKDVGLRKMGKGDILSFFINDVENIIK